MSVTVPAIKSRKRFRRNGFGGAFLLQYAAGGTGRRLRKKKRRVLRAGPEQCAEGKKTARRRPHKNLSTGKPA